MPKHGENDQAQQYPTVVHGNSPRQYPENTSIRAEYVEDGPGDYEQAVYWAHPECIAQHRLAKIAASVPAMREDIRERAAQGVVNLTEQRRLTQFADATERFVQAVEEESKQQ